jgi:hypothetical protein
MTQFNAPSRLTRAMCAAGAALTTLLVLSSVVGLALHFEYSASVQSAAVAPVGTSATLLG